jgi:hypothetical protein
MMEYLAYIFGIFGLLAYLETSSLKKKISALEEQMSGLQGTSYAENKKSLKKIATELIGKNVIIELKEEQQDYDIMMYGNTKNGNNTILDADEEWVRVRITNAKKDIEKLIRLHSIDRISMK